MADIVTVRPLFFDAFMCKASACHNTCCQKWEIDIDDATKALYETLPGELGDKVRRAMITASDGSTCFSLNDKGYCHLLTDDGLCSLVLAKGDDYLCQICRDHPRFYKTLYDDLDIAGTGLACERTVEQLIDAGELLFTDGTEVFSLGDFLYDLGYEKLLSSFQLIGPSFEDFSSMIQHLTVVEAIDDEWTARIAYWQKQLEKGYQYFSRPLPISSKIVIALFEYIAFRNLDLLADYSWHTLVRFFNESIWYILLEIYDTGLHIPSICRWSEEIEYSTENIDILLQEIG